MSVRCVLFDLFGTLVNYDASRTAQNYTGTYEYVQSLVSPGQPEPGLNYDEFLAISGSTFADLDQWSAEHQLEFSMLDYAKRLFARLGFEELDDSVFSKFSEFYTDDWSRPVTPVDGVLPLLSRCSKQFATGLITNTHHQPMVTRLLSEFQLSSFDVVTMSVSHGRPKPHASIFEDTLQALNCAPSEAVYVGDNYNADYLGATRAGLQCYLVGRHARVPREYQIPTVIDLPLHLF